MIEEIANNINEALDHLHSRGIREVPRRIETNRRYFEEARKEMSAWAVYVHNPMDITGASSNWMHLNRAILFNPRREWTDVAHQVTTMHQGSYISTGDPHHFVYHEVGHFLWQEDNRRRDVASDKHAFRSALQAMKPHISVRASAGPTEFVSEVFAQLVVGDQPVDPLVMALYHQLGGRIV